MIRVTGYLCVLALGAACSSDAPAASGTESGADVDSGSASEGSTAMDCPDCEGVCFEGECHPEPALVMQLDPEALEVTRTDYGIAYLIGDSLNGQSEVYEAPLGGTPELIFSAPPDQHITAIHFDGDLIWLEMRYPNALHVYDRTTQALTLVAETDELLNDILDVRADAIYAKTSEGVMRMGLDGSGQALVTGRPDFNAAVLTDDTIYVLRETAPNEGVLTAYELDGSNPREFASYGGFPPRLIAQGDRIFWHVGEFVSSGDDVIRGLIDDGVTANPPVTELCTDEIGPWALASESVLYGVSLTRNIWACPMDGSNGSEASLVWAAEGDDDISFFVRYDPSLVGVRSDEALTLYQFPW